MELKTNIRSKSIFGTFCKNKTIFIKYYTHNYRSSTDKIIKYNMNIREKILIKFCSEKKLSENWINTYSWYVKQLTKTLKIIFLKILQYFSVQIWKYGKYMTFSQNCRNTWYNLKYDQWEGCNHIPFHVII